MSKPGGSSAGGFSLNAMVGDPLLGRSSSGLPGPGGGGRGTAGGGAARSALRGVALLVLLGALLLLVAFAAQQSAPALSICQRASSGASSSASGVGGDGGWVRSTARAGDAAISTLAPSRPPACGRLPVLVLTIALGNDSFGADVPGTRRGLEGYLGMLAQQDYPPCALSLGLLVSDDAFYAPALEAAAAFVRDRGWARLTVVNRRVASASTAVANQTERHNDSFQGTRRNILARLRNAALSHCLATEEAVLWLDADVISMPNNTLSTMVDSGKDIITAVTTEPDGVKIYDRNAWQGPRRPYAPGQDGKAFIPGPIDGQTKFPTDFMHGPDPFVRLDSVGGCTTLVRADVHREGALFTPNFAVGGTWEKDGWDAIETEGLCYVAKSLGRSCWLAAHIVTRHQSFF